MTFEEMSLLDLRRYNEYLIKKSNIFEDNYSSSKKLLPPNFDKIFRKHAKAFLERNGYPDPKESELGCLSQYYADTLVS
jgi:hypothetical protein